MSIWPITLRVRRNSKRRGPEVGPHLRRPYRVFAGNAFGCAALLIAAVSPPANSADRPTDFAWLMGSSTPGTAPVSARLTAAVRINGVAREETVVLRGAQGDWCFASVDLKAWGIRTPESAVQLHQGQAYYCLGGLSGYRGDLDMNALILDIVLGPEAFEGAALSAYQKPPLLLPKVGYGGFLNYDFLAGRSEMPDGKYAPWRVGMLGEAVAYYPWGSLQSSFVGSNLTDADAPGLNQGRDFTRLETFWRSDFPQRMATLIVGDALGASGYWGRPSRFAGVRYTTNFETRPGFVVKPQLAFSGEAAVPSVVDVFVNNSRVQSLNVPGGPFEITGLPTFGNVGEARIVVTDLLGRQTVTTLPFLTSQRQLRAGVSSFSFEAGVARERFGLADDYGDAQAVAQYRYGFSERVTIESRVEWSGEDTYVAGAGASLRAGALGIVSPVLALSDSDAGSGSLALLTLERPSFDGIYAAGSLQWTDREFRQLGLAVNQVPVRVQLAANAGKRLSLGWNVNLGYIRQEFYDRLQVSVISAGIGRVWQGWGLSASLASRQAEENSLAVFLSVNRSFGQGIRGSSSLRQRDSDSQNSTSLRAQLQKSLPEGPGYGWRVLAGLEHQDDEATSLMPADSRTNERYELAAGLRNDYATFTGELGRANDINAVRLGAAGAIGAVERVPFASRGITRSFGMVREPALAGLPIIVNGQLTAVLDEDGYAMLPRLVPFSPNQVRVDLDQAPLDMYIDQPTVEVVAGNRSGHRVKFTALRLQAATMRLLQSDRQPVPLGADIEVLGFKDRFTVGGNGETFIAAPSTRVSLRVTWPGRVCVLDLELPPPTERPAKLGDLTCKVQS